MNWTDKINISNKDNMSLMAQFDDNHFDLAILDPEYGIGASHQSVKTSIVKQKNGSSLNIKGYKPYKHKSWDDKAASVQYLNEVKRVSKHQIIFGANYFGLKGGRIVWDKLNGDNDQFGCEIAYQSFNNRTDVIYFLWSGMMQGKYCGKNIRKALIQQGNKKLNEKRIHETQKPIALYKYLLNEYAAEGMKILDTNTGSGSLAIACHDLGFKLTGCELDEEHYVNSYNRFMDHIKQYQLF